MKLISIHLFLRGLTLTLLGIFAIGCSSSPDVFEEPAEVKSQDKAGSTHIAVLSVARWDRYHEALQPAFKLTSEDALNLALPDTLALEEKFLDALGASAKVAAGGTSVTETTTLHEETGKDPSLTRDVTEKTEPGDPSKITFGASPAGARTAAALPGGALSAALRADPMLRYWTATALYQEVQLLNRYVKDAAINEQFTPYVVRLQVGVMPQMRNEPYDAYATISFFQGDFPESSDIPHFITLHGEEHAATSLTGVRIVPLLVTDNIEAMVRSRSVDRIRQLAIGLSAMLKGVGASGEIQRLDEALRSALGRDYNSTLTVARISENTLRVRFGAMHQAGTQYAMVPRTHNVTLLLLVPREFAKCPDLEQRIVRLVSKTSMVHSKTGEPLPPRSWKQYLRQAQAVFRARAIEPPDETQLRELVRQVAENDVDEFDEKLYGFLQRTKQDDRFGYKDSLWVDLVSLRLGSQWASATLVVPQSKPPAIGDGAQVPTLIDDGKSSMTAVIRETANVDPARTRALLTMKAQRESGVVDLELLASTVTPRERGQLALVFPSLAALKLTPVGSPALHVTASASDHSDSTVAYSKTVYVLQPSAAQPPFAMSVRAKVINADGGTGRVQVWIDNPKGAEIELKVEGGDIKAMSGDSTDMLAGKKIVKSGVVTIELFNLNPIWSVVISGKAKDADAAPAPIVVPVVQMQGSGSARPRTDGGPGGATGAN